MKHEDDHCILCGAILPPDRRWRIARVLSPRFPRCTPATEACYRGLADRLGAKPTDDDVKRAVRQANR